MTARVAVIAACIGALIAAIAIVVVSWPALPARTLPKPVPVSYLPMGGQAVEVPHEGCLAPMIAELQKHPNWVLRIDDMRWTDYTQGDDDPRHASILVDANGGIWHDDWLPQQTLPLTARELADVMAGFALGCEVDESLPKTGAYEGRYLNVAYGRTEKAAARLDYHSPVVLRIGALFDAIRARYVANRAGATKQFVMKLSGLLRTGGGRDGWTKYELQLDGKGPDVSDADRVAFVDWALALPSELPKGRLTASGTLTMDGVTKPVAVSLDERRPENRDLRRIGFTSELIMWMSINRQ